MFFDTYGPFDIDTQKLKVTPKQESFWATVREKSLEYDYSETALESSFGCYIFGMRFGQILTPWYVGQTICERGFRGEVFQEHKRKIYNSLLKKRGAPILFFFPLLTPEDKFSKSRSDYNKKLITWTERTLFGMCFARNPKFLNKHAVGFIKGCTINGVLGTHLGRTETMASDARRMLLPVAK